MQTSQELKNIFKAISECKKDFVPLQKNKKGYGYYYVTLDVIIDMLNMVLPKHGLGFVQFPSITGNDYTLTTRVFHESGEWMEDTINFPLTDIAKANDTQKLGASLTYFRRYTISSIFGIAADEDVDGNISTALELDTIQKKQFNEQQRQSQYKQVNYQNNYQSRSQNFKQQEVVKENFLTKEKYENLYLTNDEACNEILKALSVEEYKNSFVLTDKTKEFINSKVDEGTFATKEEYLSYVKRVSSVNRKKIDANLSEQQDVKDEQKENTEAKTDNSFQSQSNSRVDSFSGDISTQEPVEEASLF